MSSCRLATPLPPLRLPLKTDTSGCAKAVDKAHEDARTYIHPTDVYIYQLLVGFSSDIIVHQGLHRFLHHTLLHYDLFTISMQIDRSLSTTGLFQHCNRRGVVTSWWRLLQYPEIILYIIIFLFFSGRLHPLHSFRARAPVPVFPASARFTGCLRPSHSLYILLVLRGPHTRTQSFPRQLGHSCMMPSSSFFTSCIFASVRSFRGSLWIFRWWGLLIWLIWDGSFMRYAKLNCGLLLCSALGKGVGACSISSALWHAGTRAYPWNGCIFAAMESAWTWTIGGLRRSRFEL